MALVLNSITSKGGRPSEHTFNTALDTLGFDKTRHRHHGYRTTYSTNINEMDWNPDRIAMQPAHVPREKARGVYNKATWLSQWVEMMQAYADWLDEMEAAHGTARARQIGSVLRK